MKRFSTLGNWKCLWDRPAGSGLVSKEFRKLRALGFDIDHVSFQLVVVRHREKIQEWDDQKIRKILLTAFPSLQANPSQRKKAARWAAVLKLYFHAGMSSTDVAHYLNYPLPRVKDVLRRATRVSQGYRASGGVLRSGKRGRPKLNKEIV